LSVSQDLGVTASCGDRLTEGLGMAYLDGFAFDLFVSYAHVDNIPMGPADRGWVDALVRDLEITLDMKKGSNNRPVIWRDLPNLRGNQEVTGISRCRNLLRSIRRPPYRTASTTKSSGGGIPLPWRRQFRGRAW
jgi:hypothetical protein